MNGEQPPSGATTGCHDSWGRSLVLELRGITKRFGSVVANQDVDFSLAPGEVHAIVGENGAGKTTLMRILYGMYRPDAGQMKLHGEPVTFDSPLDSIRHRIGMVHQHFMLVPSLTVLENITLGAEPQRRGIFDRQAALRAARDPMAKLGLTVAPDTIAGELSVANQQKLEIIKVLYRGAEVIILDEPTAVLTPQETDELFHLLREMASGDTSIVFISHKLGEVFGIADRITVLRQGKSVHSAPTCDTNATEIVAAMTGGAVSDLRRSARPAINDPRTVLNADAISTVKPAHDAALDKVSFSVRSGEILGIAGVEGNGQSVLGEALIGTAAISAGSLHINGHDISRCTVAERRDLGLGYVPEDRRFEGIPLHGTVLEGLAAGRLRQVPARRAMDVAVSRQLRRWGSSLIEQYLINTSGTDAPCRTLSGGNQQKVVLARELEGRCNCMILAQPTRGVDLVAIDFLYDRITEATSAGCAVVLISADLDEILEISDRVLVMCKGAVVAERQAAETTREELGAYMLGATAQSAVGARHP